MGETEQEQVQEPTPDETPAETPQETPQEPTEPAPDETPDTTPDEPTEPQEPPSEPTSAPPPTPEALEKRTRSAEQRYTRYAKGIEELYEGTEVRLVGCPLCPDQHKGFVDLNFAGRIPEDVAENVKYYLGMARPIEYRPSRRYHTCEECDGEGKVQTGSHVPGKDTIGCEVCNGRGFMPAPGAEVKNGLTGPTTLTTAQLENLNAPPEDVDVWNEPRLLPDGRENPNYGKMPQMKILVEPWGVTAGLTALDTVS